MRAPWWLLLTASVACAPQVPDPIAPRFNDDGGVRRQALLFGRLAVRNGCFVILAPESEDVSFIPIWHNDSVAGGDDNGPYIRNVTTDDVLRPGDRISGSGGFLGQDRATLNRQVTPTIPPACAGRFASFHNVRPWTDIDLR